MAFVVVIALLVVAVAELGARAMAAITGGGRLSASRLQERRDALIESGGRVAIGANVRWARDESLHPYVGYVPGPDGGDAAQLLGAAGHVLPRRAPDRVIVAVVGGSVAHAFGEEGLPHLLARLSTLDVYRGRTFVPLNLAVAGYKQPQQLMTIAYLLALGAEFDIVINLDGFNDVTMHPTENAAHGVPLAYPRRWDQRVAGIFQGGSLRLMLRRVVLEQRRARLAAAFSHLPWRVLYTANLLYLACDRILEGKQGEIDRELLRGSNAAAPPAAGSAGDARMYQGLVALWERSSLELSWLAAADGARYHHFLQPNQYLAGSKPLAATERAQAWVADHPYRRAVETAYPSLQKAGRTLQERGVRFTDLSGAFADHPEPLYIDSCCHVNRRGNLILADAIFDALRRDRIGPGRP